MNRILYVIILIIGTLIITFYSEWWMIVILCGILSYFYDKSLVEKIAIVTSMFTIIWLGLAAYQEALVVDKASTMVANIFGSIAPSLIYTITAMVITIPSIMATGLGHRLKSSK